MTSLIVMLSSVALRFPSNITATGCNERLICFFLCDEIVKMFTVGELRQILLVQMQGTATLQLDTDRLGDTGLLLAIIYSSKCDKMS